MGALALLKKLRTEEEPNGDDKLGCEVVVTVDRSNTNEFRDDLTKLMIN